MSISVPSAAVRGIKAAAVYGVIGGIWILLSDQFLYMVVGDAGRAATWQTWKGWAFVAASAVFVFVLARRAARREYAVLKREAELLVITDSLPGPVSRVDRTGRYLFANAAYTEWFGLTPSEVVGRTHPEVLGEDLHRRIAPHVQRALGGERVQYFEPAQGPDGKTRWGLVTLIPDRGEDGAVAGHFTIVLDVTEAEERRRAHAESEARYRRLVEKAPDGILVYKDGRIQFANPAAQRLVGAATESDLTGRPWDMFVDEPDRELAMARVEQLLQGEGDTVAVELVLRRLDGTKVPVEVSGVRFRDGDAPALHLIMRDVSARKSAETALRELTRSMEERIARRTQKLELACQRAESADRLKSLFLASMSRELRAPIDSIIRLNGELLRGTPSEPSVEQSKRLDAAQRAARHLQELVDDVLEISSIEAGELELESAEYDLAAVVRQVAEQLAPGALAKGLDFEVRIDNGLERAGGDAERVAQVLTRLVANAVKFTDEGRVAVIARALAGDGARIEVSDTGIGIAPAYHEQIFHPFSHVRAPDDHHPGGTGLGMAIARRLARLMGGELAVASAPGAGSTFTLEIPLRTDSRTAHGPQGHA